MWQLNFSLSQGQLSRGSSSMALYSGYCPNANKPNDQLIRDRRWWLDRISCYLLHLFNTFLYLNAKLRFSMGPTMHCVWNCSNVLQQLGAEACLLLQTYVATDRGAWLDDVGDYHREQHERRHSNFPTNTGQLPRRTYDCSVPGGLSFGIRSTLFLSRHQMQ